MLETTLRKRIEEYGPLRLDHFINEVMYNKTYGYYRTIVPIGKQSDFITAPEICSLFGELIGFFLLDYWCRVNYPHPVRLVELGPGTGRMMRDILASFRLRPFIFKYLTVHLVEVSESLKKVQQENLISYPFISWHSCLSQVPDGFQLIVANEFFDAFPIRQFVYQKRWRERFVTFEDNKFCFIDLPSRKKPLNYIPDKPCVIETSQSSLIYADLIATRLLKYGGLGLFIDYGEEKEPWIGDSLQALNKHLYVDVFTHIGKADISHHVNFIELKNRFSHKGLTTFGIRSQGEFLTSLGIEGRLQQQRSLLCLNDFKKLQTALFRLINPRFMGQLFKVLAISDNSKILPAGF